MLLIFVPDLQVQKLSIVRKRTSYKGKVKGIVRKRTSYKGKVKGIVRKRTSYKGKVKGIVRKRTSHKVKGRRRARAHFRQRQNPRSSRSSA